MANQDNESPQLLVDADDTVAADGSPNELDDNTVAFTPRPLAASTVVRHGRKSERFLQGHGVQGSFLDDTSLSVASKVDDGRPPSSLADSQGSKIPKGNLQFSIDQSMNDQSILSERSSLGLLPSDVMEDLSASLMHVPDSLLKQKTEKDNFHGLDSRNKSGFNRKSMENSCGLAVVNRSVESSASSTGTLKPASTQNSTSLWNTMSTLQSFGSRTKYADTPRPTQEQKRTLHGQIIDEEDQSAKVQNYQGQGHVSQGQGQTLQGQGQTMQGQGHVSQGHGSALPGQGHPVEITPGGMLFGQGDLDMSVVDVEINEDELKDLDEDFSDIDTTLADSPPPTGFDLRTELLMAEQSMREEENQEDSQVHADIVDFSIDIDQTPTFLRPRPVVAMRSREESPAYDERPRTTGQADCSNSESFIDSKLLQQATPGENLETNEDSPTHGQGDSSVNDDSINFAASLRGVVLPQPEPQAPAQIDQSVGALSTASLSGNARAQTPNQDLSLLTDSSLDSVLTAQRRSQHSQRHLSDLFDPTPSPPAARAAVTYDRSLFPADDTSFTNVTSASSTSYRGSDPGHQGGCADRAVPNERRDNAKSPQENQGVFSPNTSGSAFVPYSQESQRQRDWGDVFSAAQDVAQHQRDQNTRDLVSGDSQRDMVIPDSNNTSLIDTDDEIAAARQENARAEERSRRQRGVGSGNVDTHGSRPGLEGGSSEDNDPPVVTSRRLLEARQSAEGDVMTSPLMGDGGGGGDGSSGHGSDDGRGPSTSGTPLSGAAQAAGPTTSDILRGLGLSAFSPGTSSNSRMTRASFVEDNPESQERIRPMGDDLLSEKVSSERRVHFASMTDTRGRTLSGASDNSDDDQANSPGTQSPDVQGSQENLLASQLLQPSSGTYGNSLSASQRSVGWGLEHSTFCLNDLVPQGAGPQRGGASPGHAHSGIAHWDQGDGQDDDDDDNDDGQQAGPANSLFFNQLQGEDETDAIDFTFSRNISFGNMNFSQLQPSTSPISDRTSAGGASSTGGASGVGGPVPGMERRGSRDSFASSLYSRDSFPPESDNRGAAPHPLEHTPDDKEPGNGDGPQGFRDLSCRGNFDEELAAMNNNPFDLSAGPGFGDFPDVVAGAGDFNSSFGGQFGDDDFISADQGLALIAEDEMECERENRFLQPETLPEHNATLGLPESWTYMSTMEVTTAEPDLGAPAPRRVSIGTMLSTRSMALGSLDGYSSDIRPSFGTINPVTSPAKRRPAIKLITSPPDDVFAGSNDDVRGAGVGIEDTDGPLQAEDLEESPDPVNRSDSRLSTQNQSAHVGDQSQNYNNSAGDDLERPPSAADRTTDLTTAINISTISNLISSTSAQANPDELAAMIMKMSTEKLASRSRKGSAKGSSSTGDGEKADQRKGGLKDQRTDKKAGAGTERGRYDNEHDNRPRSDASNQRRPDGKSDQSKPRQSFPRARSPAINSNHVQNGKGPNSSHTESSSAPAHTTNGEQMGSSNGSSASGRSGKNRPSPPPLNGHTKIPMYQWNDTQAAKPSTTKDSREVDPRSASSSRSAKQPLSDTQGSKRSHQNGHMLEQNGQMLENESSDNDRYDSEHQRYSRRDEQESKWRERKGQSYTDRAKTPLNEVSGNQDDINSGKFRGGHRDERAQQKENWEATEERLSLERDAESRASELSPQRFKSPRISMIASVSRPEHPYRDSFLEEDSVAIVNKREEVYDQGHQSTPKKVHPQNSLDPDLSIPNDLQQNNTQKSTDSWQRNLPPERTLKKSTPFSANPDRQQTNISNTSHPLQSLSVVSDQFNADDRTQTSRRLQSASVISDQFNASELSPDASRRRGHSTSVISDVSSQGDRDGWRLQSKENQPPENPVSHLGVTPAFNKSLESSYFIDRQYPTSTTSLKKPLSTTSISSSSKQILASSNVPIVPHIPVGAPQELRMSEVCCVGLSVQATLPLHNPSDRWVHVHLQTVTVEVDNDRYDPNRFIPFVMKERVIIEPRTTENVKVIFSPRLPGVYVGQLYVSGRPVGSDQPVTAQHVPTMVTLQGIAESPDIQVLTEGGSGELSFGALPWGCERKLQVRLLNRGRASVPVRLVLTSERSSAVQCFSFEKQGSGDSSIISLTRPPNAPVVAPSVANYTLPGSAYNDVSPEPLPVAIYFRSPPSRQDIRVPALDMPEDYTARLNIEVDTPSSDVFVGFLGMRAAVGTVRLHAPLDMEVVQFEAEVGGSQTLTIPLRNAGSLPLEVNLEVHRWPEYFTVTPSVFRLHPGTQQDVALRFKPTQSSTNQDESFLLMFVEPGGTSYEISLCWKIPAPVPRPLPPPARPANAGPVILSNKDFLGWGGVPLGRALQQSVTLMNNSDSLLKFKMEIRGATHEFQLVSRFGAKEQLSSRREMVLRPREEHTVNLLFAPSQIAHFTGKIQLKPADSSTKYAIPLSGYGGISSLVLEGVEKNHPTTPYWTSVGPLSTTSRHIVIKTTVRNTGTRTAYVKALCFKDLGCRQRASEGVISVQPSEFCLRPDSTQPLKVIFKPSEREIAMCLDQSNIISTVALFYGDEISRRKYRRTLIQKGGLIDLKLSETNPVRGINFNVHYQGESWGQEEEDIPTQTHNDVELFYSTMTKTSLALIGEPDPQPELLTAPQIMSYSSQPAPDILSGSRIQTTPSACLFPVTRVAGQLSPDENQQRKPLPQDWYLKPEQLILTASSENPDPEVKRVELVNLSEYPLHFELLLPGRVLTANPDQGTVPPRSSTTICVSANSTLYTRGVHLPWRGHVHVDCDGESKALKVQVHEDPMDKAPLKPALTKKGGLPEVSVPLVTVTTTGLSQAPDYLKLSHKSITLPDTPIHKNSDISMDLTNVTDQYVSWHITWFAPVFIKDADSGSNDGVARSTYSVFKLSKHYGVLEPRHQEKITVQFSPRGIGSFSQFWELVTRTQGPLANINDKSRIEFVGQGIYHSPSSVADSTGHQSISTTLSANTLTTVSTDFPTTSSSRRKRGLTVPSHLEFPTLGLNESHKLFMKVRNQDPVEYKVDVIAPKSSSFKIKHKSLSLRGRHYCGFPVTFTPKHPGSYHEVVILKADNGLTLTTQLVGYCSG